MLAPALDDSDPVLIFENIMLYNDSAEIDETLAVDIDRAAVRRQGSDISLITYGGSLGKALAAAGQLEQDGISAEVLDLRVLRPLDEPAILATVAKTRRALIIDEGWRSGSISAEIMARIIEGAFWELDAPIARLCSAEVPIPYPKHLEDAALPGIEGIVAAARRALGR
jgi:pyruvate/2-oxoglutarate/acetoin dehydrogenase E1 component